MKNTYYIDFYVKYYEGVILEIAKGVFQLEQQY